MSSNGGFTLIELILVTVIIGILSGMVTLTFAGRAEEARIKAAKGDIMSYNSAIELYALDHNGKYPKSLEDLTNGDRKYVRDVKPDPWKNTYIYECPGSIHRDSYDVYSAGADGIKGNADDVTELSDD
ncbi:MAG TPA: type II secretion system protein GspG [Candidatus Hydrogenedentes bacterium]|mgnify:CR=1 FL=1|nr:type II secretion system protein GspG [Candidatus Hydrogenedentota bacterium]HPG65291.1 type II secretion system protein GspG [Candidatus Hydrogenedentota bacterium]